MSMTDNELLLAISRLLDVKLRAELCTIKNDLQMMKREFQLSYNRYENYADKMEALLDDVKMLKKVVNEHSEKLQEIS